MSDASFDFDDVQGFLYGPVTFRLWMMRKHIISMSNEEINKYGMPFYYWDCITLLLKNREVTLVIRNEMCMAKFIKLLIYKLETVDVTEAQPYP